MTASTVLGLLIFFYGWMVINLELLADPAILGVSFLFIAQAVKVFVWPLWGVRRMMGGQKARTLDEIELQF